MKISKEEFLSLSGRLLDPLRAWRSQARLVPSAWGPQRLRPEICLP